MQASSKQGLAWRSAERRTAQCAKQEGFVSVEITPIYEQILKRLNNGVPIPCAIRRIKSRPTDKILEDITVANK
jgi:hypothetical protein